MYTRSYNESRDGKNDEIPVQTFSDSFSADAYIKTKPLPKPKSETTLQTDTDNESESNKTIATLQINNQANTRKLFGLEFEDLLIIGLLLLYMSDTEKKDDMIIPVVLAILLLI